MSKLAGLYRFGPVGVSVDDTERIAASLRTSGRGRVEFFRAPGLLVGCLTGDPARRAITRSPGGDCCAWDGRLDSSESGGRRAGYQANWTEADCALEAYRAKGTGGLCQLVGDWSVSIWDARKRRVILASDYAGVRPLYYYRTPQCVYWSSSLSDLIEWSGVTDLDETFVATFLLRGRVAERTPFRGIYSVLPGHAVSISEEETAKSPFWKVPTYETRYADETAYEEHFRSLFREAVGSRLNTDGPVCAELSGGLDSSSVVCVANALGEEQRREPDWLRTLSYTHDRNPDEKYIREVERACGLSASRLDLDHFPPVTPAYAGGDAPRWWEPRFRELASYMDRVRSSVILTGQMGDFVMGNTTDDSAQVAGLLAQGRCWRATKEAYAWARSLQVPIYPMLLRNIRAAWSSWTPSTDEYEAQGTAPHNADNSLTGRLREAAKAEEEESIRASDWKHAGAGVRLRLRALIEFLHCRNLETPQPLLHASCTHPFSHRPLIEFMMTIPPQIVCRPGEPRRLMRHALSGVLPELVRTRRSKGAYTAAYHQSVARLARIMLDAPRDIQLVARGYADRANLIGRLKKLTQGIDCNESQLRTLILFEFWLRTSTGRHLEMGRPGARARDLGSFRLAPVLSGSL